MVHEGHAKGGIIYCSMQSRNGQSKTRITAIAEQTPLPSFFESPTVLIYQLSSMTMAMHVTKKRDQMFVASAVWGTMYGR